MASAEESSVINTETEDLVRVYADISREADRKIRLRCIMLESELHKRVTRKEYLEKLIADDTAKVKGASLREVNARRSQKG